MPLKPARPFMQRHTYIPPHVQQAMDRQMQRSMPAHLKKYTENSSGFIPRHAEKAIAQHMEKAVPAQFKKYAGAYVQQKVTSHHLAVARSMPQTQAAPGPTSHSPAAFAPTQSHFQAAEKPSTPETVISIAHPESIAQAAPEQVQPPMPSPGQTVGPAPQPEPTASPQQPDTAATPPPMYPAAPVQPVTPPPQEYDFIMNPGQPVKKLSLPGGSSVIGRAALVGGGLVVLLVIFIIVKGLLSGGNPSLTSFVGIAQDQQELMHLAANAGQQQTLATTNKNFAATAQLSLTSSQAAIVKYLANNGQKVDPKILSLKLNKALDTQLLNAVAATTYDQTFQQIMQSKLADYTNAIRQTYFQTKGVNGRALLNDDYHQAQLLLVQLNTSPQSAQ